MALSIVSRSDSRMPSARGSSRNGLYALASAWHVSMGGNVHPFARPASSAASSQDTATSGAQPEPPYWPDGPSAA